MRLTQPFLLALHRLCTFSTALSKPLRRRTNAQPKSQAIWPLLGLTQDPSEPPRARVYTRLVWQRWLLYIALLLSMCFALPYGLKHLLPRTFTTQFTQPTTVYFQTSTPYVPPMRLVQHTPAVATALTSVSPVNPLNPIAPIQSIKPINPTNQSVQVSKPVLPATQSSTSKTSASLKTTGQSTLTTTSVPTKPQAPAIAHQKLMQAVAIPTIASSAATPFANNLKPQATTTTPITAPAVVPIGVVPRATNPVAEPNTPAARMPLPEGRTKDFASAKEFGLLRMNASSVVRSNGSVIRVGERFPNGETLLAVNPALSLIETDKRTMHVLDE